jgi:hypothetical protein
MGRTACTKHQCLYSRAIPLLSLWAVQPVQSLSVCTRLHFTFTFTPAVTLKINSHFARALYVSLTNLTTNSTKQHLTVMDTQHVLYGKN